MGELGLDATEADRRVRATQAKLRDHVKAHPKVIHRQPARESTFEAARRRVDEGGTVHLNENQRRRAYGTLNSGGMSAQGNTKWPLATDCRLSPDEYKSLRDCAAERGVSLSGFRKSDVDIAAAKRMIDASKDVTDMFPELLGSGRKQLTFELADAMGTADFAKTPGQAPHILRLNANAMRDMAALEREYAASVTDRWFVKGTTCEAIVYHEMGHMYASVNKISPMRIARSIMGCKGKELELELKNNLSRYSMARRDGSEIIAEVFSAWFSKTGNEFAEAFMKDMLNLR